MFTTGLDSGASAIDLFGRLTLGFRVTRHTTVLITYYERYIVMVYQDRFRDIRVLLNEDATGARYGVM